MPKVISAIRITLGTLAATLIFAAQTKPEEAESNLSGWIERIGANTPQWLQTQSADVVATYVGGLILVGLLLWWWLGKRSKAQPIGIIGDRQPAGNPVLEAVESIGPSPMGAPPVPIGGMPGLRDGVTPMAEFIERQNHIAEVEQTLERLRGRIRYVTDAMKDGGDRLSVWREKVKLESQNVRFDESNHIPHGAGSRDALNELNGVPKLASGSFNDEHVANLYLKRAQNAERQLSILCEILSDFDNQAPLPAPVPPISFSGLIEAKDTPKPDHCAVRVIVRNETDQNLTGLVARLVETATPLGGLNGDIGLPLTLATKERLDRLRNPAIREQLPASGFDLHAHSEQLVEVVWIHSSGAIQGFITHQGGDGEFLFVGSQDFLVEVTGAGRPITAIVRINVANDDAQSWKSELVV